MAAWDIDSIGNSGTCNDGLEGRWLNFSTSTSRTFRYRDTWCSVNSWTAAVGIKVRNEYIRKCRLRLFSVLGACVLRGRLLYWRVSDWLRAEIKGPMKKAFLNRRQACSLHWRRTNQEGK